MPDHRSTLPAAAGQRFPPGDPLPLSFDRAQAIFAGQAMALGIERLPFARSGGRRLAADIAARIDAPRFDCAAMDGYAVRNVDVAAGTTEFATLGRSYAGGKIGGRIGAGEAWRVMTGAALPDGADRVLLIEDCGGTADSMVIERAPGAKPHVRPKGSDFRRGQILLEAGQMMTPQAMIVAAAADVPRLSVWRRPRVHILTTGDEIVPPGRAFARPFATPDSLADALSHLCGQWGAGRISVSRCGDDPREIEQHAAAASPYDILIVVGGASRGDRDFARAGLAQLGLRPLVCGVLMKPGKPLWYGRLGAAHVVGLPGNPTAALTAARLFAAPLLAGLAGAGHQAALRWRSMSAARNIPQNGPREAFLCASDVDGEVTIINRQQASSQAMLIGATHLARRLPSAPAIGRGEPVLVLRL